MSGYPVGVFRRRSASADTDSHGESASPEAAETGRPRGYTPKKGVPTPKRREAETNPRRPVKAPETRKEAYQAYRERLDRQRGRGTATSKALRGVPQDEARYYRPADFGPARAFARDYVDSRRTASEFFLPFSILVILVLFFTPPGVQFGVAYGVWPLMMLTIIVEGVFTGRKVKRLAVERFPDDDLLRGIGMYAAMRQLQFRRLRLPKPKVKVGDRPELGGR
ncbi:DUF3043 domain-containing protein [Nocardiopsis algeriensis]|uniref:DUF3043 domain-containing protein n=1 Tax=Nocardiopsis algeriensis TaxID=1478215 RepID=UPI003B4337E5